MLTYGNVFCFFLKFCKARNTLTRTINVFQCKEYCCSICTLITDWVLCNCTAIISKHIYVISCEHWPCSNITSSKLLSVYMYTVWEDYLYLGWNFKDIMSIVEYYYIQTESYTNLLFWCSIAPYLPVHIVYVNSIFLRCLVEHLIS